MKEAIEALAHECRLKATNDAEDLDRRERDIYWQQAKALDAILAEHVGQPMETAPKDGTTIRLVRGWMCAPAYWCGDLKRWVTTREVTINYVNNPLGWSRWA